VFFVQFFVNFVNFVTHVTNGRVLGEAATIAFA